MLWDITTKFLPVEDLMRSQLFINFYGYSLKNGAATPLTIWNFSRAWQAYFLSNNLQIWWENTSFNDLQMIWNNVFDTSISFWFEKIWLSCTVHFCSLYLDKVVWWFFVRNRPFIRRWHFFLSVDPSLPPMYSLVSIKQTVRLTFQGTKRNSTFNIYYI